MVLCANGSPMSTNPVAYNLPTQHAAQVHCKAITVPGRALAGIISCLKADLEPEAFDLLQSFHQQVVNHLRAVSAQDPSVGSELVAKQEELVDKLGPLKSLVGTEQ